MKMFNITANILGCNRDNDNIVVFCESRAKLKNLIDDGVFDRKCGWTLRASYLIQEIDKIDETEKILGVYNLCGF